MNSPSSRADKEIRMVLVGKTGSGKSATGNTILGGQHFQSEFSAESVTVDCLKRVAEVDGRRLTVIDTPGLFDTRFGRDKTIKDVCQCISFASPGPHIFLVVIGLGRYTPEEKETVQRIQDVFGQAADKYSMVLFTNGDRLGKKTIEEFLSQSQDLQELVDRCNGQYHVFNNESTERSQVSALINKITEIVQKNGGSHYTNEMFREATRTLQEETQRILREKEEELHREKEEMERKIKEKYEAEMKKIEEEHQAERSRREKEREEERERERMQMEERLKVLELEMNNNRAQAMEERAREQRDWQQKEWEWRSRERREREEREERREEEQRDWQQREREWKEREERAREQREWQQKEREWREMERREREDKAREQREREQMQMLLSKTQHVQQPQCTIS